MSSAAVMTRISGDYMSVNPPAINTVHMQSLALLGCGNERFPPLYIFKPPERIFILQSKSVLKSFAVKSS
jgi:hypothetical protein